LPARRGKGWLSTRFAAASWGIEPVVSLRDELSELKPEKRPESLQPATANPINAMATTCGPMAEQRDAPMVLARTQQNPKAD
jgi:hypothetical protein